MEVTPPVAGYEQLAASLRRRIISGVHPADSTLPSGPELAREAGVSQHMVQRAFEILAREGLVRMTAGSGTRVLPLRRWTVVLALADGEDAGAVDRAAREHAAVDRVRRDGSAVTLTVASANWGGASLVAASAAGTAAMASVTISEVPA